MIETGRYTSVLFCLQFRIRIHIYASGPCSCRDLTDETYIFEPYCKSVRLPRRTPTSHAARQQWWAAVLLQSPWKGPYVCVCVCLTLLLYSAASLILLLHHSGAKHKNQKKHIKRLYTGQDCNTFVCSGTAFNATDVRKCIWCLVSKLICIQLYWYSANKRNYFWLFQYAVHCACTRGFTQGGCTLLLPRNLDQQAEVAAVVGTAVVQPLLLMLFLALESPKNSTQNDSRTVAIQNTTLYKVSLWNVDMY